MSFQIRGWRSSEQLPFIGNVAAAPREHLQDIKAALSACSVVNVAGFCGGLLLSTVMVGCSISA